MKGDNDLQGPFQPKPFYDSTTQLGRVTSSEEHAQGPPGKPVAEPNPGSWGLTLMMTQSAWPRAQGLHFACTSRLGFQWKRTRSSPAVSTEQAWHRATRHVAVW